MPAPPVSPVPYPVPLPYPTTKVSDVIYAAYRIAGILDAAGRAPNVSETADGLNTANALLDSWNAQRLTIYNIQRVVFPLVANQQTYQIGPGAKDWNIPRPPKIEVCGILIMNNPSQPLERPCISLTYQNWQQIPVKNITTPIPTQFWYDQAFPVGNVNFWPIPNTVNQVALYLWQTIQAFQSASDLVVFPPAYLRAIEYNLAAELADRFPLRAKMTQRGYQTAKESLGQIKSLNTPIIDIQCDAAAVGSKGGQWNWLTGDWVRP